MSLKLGNFDINDDRFKLWFLAENGSKRTTIHISLGYEWRQQAYVPEGIVPGKTGQAIELLSGFYVLDFTTDFTRDYTTNILQQVLKTNTLNIPNDLTRELFIQIINLWADYNNCPLQAKETEHPRYPLVSIVFNKHIIENKHVGELTDEILLGIGNAEIMEWEEDEDEDVREDTTDFDDEVDENEIVEYELDPEISILRNLKILEQTKTEESIIEDYEEISTGEIIKEDGNK